MTVIASCLRRLCATSAAVIALLWCAAAPASAHAALLNTTPAQGAVTATAPGAVVLQFSEKVTFSPDGLRVLDPRGRRVDTGPPTARGGAVYAVRLGGDLAEGTYTVGYHVVSADSHPISGAYTFSIGAPSPTATSATDSGGQGGAVSVVYAAARALAYAAIILLLGGAGFVLLCWPAGCAERVVRRTIAAAWLAVVAATGALLVLRGAYTASGRWSEVTDASLLWQVVQSRFGLLLCARLVMLAVAAACWARWRAVVLDTGGASGRGRGILLSAATLAAGALAFTWADAEHASVGLQVPVAVPVDMVHLVAAGLWLGGLSILALALWRIETLDTAAVERFSRLAFGCVCVLVITGLYQTWRQVGSPAALVDTRFGHLLLIKAGMIAAMVAVAAGSRRLTGRLVSLSEGRRPAASVPAVVAVASGGRAQSASGTAAGPGRLPPRDGSAARRQDRRRMRWSVSMETAVGAGILAVTVLLTSTEPARTQQAVAAAQISAQVPVTADLPFDTGGTHGRGTVSVVLDPGRRGANAVHVSVLAPNGSMLDVPEVRVALTSAGAGIGPLGVPLRRAAAGHWTADGFQVPQGGLWKVAVTVRSSAIDEVTVRRSVSVG